MPLQEGVTDLDCGTDLPTSNRLFGRELKLSAARTEGVG